MFYIIDCFPGWLFNIGSFYSQGGLRLKSQQWNIIGKTIRPNQWQIRNLVNVLERCTLGVIQYRYTSLLDF